MSQWLTVVIKTNSSNFTLQHIPRISCPLPLEKNIFSQQILWIQSNWKHIHQNTHLLTFYETHSNRFIPDSTLPVESKINLSASINSLLKVKHSYWLPQGSGQIQSIIIKNTSIDLVEAEISLLVRFLARPPITWSCNTTSTFPTLINQTV